MVWSGLVSGVFLYEMTKYVKKAGNASSAFHSLKARGNKCCTYVIPRSELGVFHFHLQNKQLHSLLYI